MSDLTDVSTWRLSTPGGIKYRLKEGKPTGSIGEQVELEEVYIIQASDYMAFVAESFPSSEWVDGTWIFQSGRSCPGFNGALTRTVSFASLDPTKPCDPQGNDPDAPEGTYCQFLELTISYATKSEDAGSGGSGDPNNPETYLEVSADASASFFAIKADGTDAEFQYNVDYNVMDDDGTANPIAIGEWGPAIDVDLPTSKVEAATEWNVRFPNFQWRYLPNLMTIARPMLGSINSATMTLFGNAPAGTILFTGISVRKTWQVQQSSGSDHSLTMMAQVDMKFSEKAVTNAGSSAILGHNYFYRPETNTYDLLHIKGAPVYKSKDLNTLWV